MITLARSGRLLPLLALGAASCGAPVSNVNADVHAAIEQAWSRPTVGLVLGNVRFVEPGAGVLRADVSKGEDLRSELPIYRAAAANQLITLSEDQGVFVVAATDSGRRRGTLAKVDNTDELLVRINTARIETIVANDSLMAGEDQYRIVQGTYTYDIDDDFKAAYVEARGDRLPRERRFKALLKYDPIVPGWAYLMADAGPRTGEFATPLVDRAVAQLQQCGKVAC